MLYDTGMGIASIKNAIAEVRKAEGLPERDIMVLNSHAHLDHIGDNHEFDEIYGFNHEWRIRKITEGIPAGNKKWIDYYASLTGTPRPPENYTPATMSVPPVNKGKIRFMKLTAFSSGIGRINPCINMNCPDSHDLSTPAPVSRFFVVQNSAATATPVIRAATRASPCVKAGS